MISEEKAEFISNVCVELAEGNRELANSILQSSYPFLPLYKTGRRYSCRSLMAVYKRDGFIDRYTGRKLIFPGTLRLLSRIIPETFPFHVNWKTDSCHFAFYELYPTLDHLIPVSRNGPDVFENWVTTSMLRNASKANFTLDELGWTLYPPGDLGQWDGLTTWFLEWISKDDSVLSEKYLQRWHEAARSN